MEEFEEALRAGPDIVMLDEFSLADMRAAVARNNSNGIGSRSKLQVA